MNDPDAGFLGGAHHCPRMDRALSDERLPVAYWEKFREYGILYTDGSIQIMHFCPWCGTKLPISVRPEWFDRLDGMGLEPGDSRIPDGMLTDQWWKDENL